MTDTQIARRRIYRERLVDILEEQASEAVLLDRLADTAANQDRQDLRAAARMARALALAAITALASDDLNRMRQTLIRPAYAAGCGRRAA